MASNSLQISTHPSYYVLIEQHLLPVLELDDDTLFLYDSKLYDKFEKNISTLIGISELSIVHRDVAHLLLSVAAAEEHLLLEIVRTILEIEYQYSVHQYLLHGYSFYIMQSTGFTHMAGSLIARTMSDRAGWSLQANTIGIDANLQNNRSFMADITTLNHQYHEQHIQSLDQLKLVTYQDFVTIQKDCQHLDALLNQDVNENMSEDFRAESLTVDSQHAASTSSHASINHLSSTVSKSDNSKREPPATAPIQSDQTAIQLIFYNNAKQYDFHELISTCARNTYNVATEDIILEIGSSTICSTIAEAMLCYSMTDNIIKRYISYLPTLTRTYATRLLKICSGVLEDGSVAILENIQPHMYKLLSYILLGYASYSQKQSRTPCVVIYQGDWLTKQILESIVQLCKTASQQLPFNIMVVYSTPHPYLKQITFPHRTYSAGYGINKSLILQHIPKVNIVATKQHLNSIIRFDVAEYHCMLAKIIADRIVPYESTMAKIPSPIRNLYQLILLLPVHIRAIVYIVSLLGHYIYINHVIKFFQQNGYAVSAINTALKTLVQLGIIRNGSRCQLYSTECADFFRAHCIKFYPRLAEKVAHYYYQQWHEQWLPLSVNLLEVMNNCKSEQYCREIVIELMHYYVLKRDPRALHKLSEICAGVLQQWSGTAVRLHTGQLVLQYIHIHVILYDNTKSTAQQSSSTSYGDEITATIEYGYYLLAVARNLYYHRQTDQALHTITKSILVFQESENNIGLTRSYIDASCYLLSSGKLQDAEHYINIAVEIAPDSLPTVDYFHLLGIQTSIAFALGDYSQVLQLAERHKKHADYQEWILFVQFLAARALFEIGDYAQAIKEFIRGINISRVNSNTLANELFAIWLARTHAYIGNFDKAEKLLTAVTAKQEMLLVMAELYLLQKKYNESMQYIKRFADLTIDRTRSMYETPDFRNGYIGCSSDHGVMMSRIAQAIQGYLSSKMGKFSVAQKTLQHLIHIENISHNDPYLPIYYLYYSEVTRDNATPENIKLRLLLIGRALKCMQECSRMISDTRHRIKYVKQNKWNKKIVRYAEQYNLL